MSATHSQSDKFIFLFRTDASFDLSKAKEAFHNYYNYSSGVNNTIEATGCANFKNSFKTILNNIVANIPSGSTPNGETPLNTFVVVILGNADASGLKDGATSAVSWTDLRSYISGTFGASTIPYSLYTEVHVICLTPFCNSLVSQWDQSLPVTSGTLIVPPTVTDALAPAAAQTFLDNWTNYLKLSTALPVDAYGRISFNDIASAMLGAQTANLFRTAGAGNPGKFFPGFCAFEIKDGNPNLWESPDINIHHPLDVSYGTGFETGYLKDNLTSIRNYISVKVTNSGTHPLKKFRIDLGVYKQSIAIPGIPNISSYKDCGFIKGGEKLDIEFTDVRLSDPDYANLVVAATYSGDTNFADANISANTNEAQRSIALINESLDFTFSKTNVTPIGGTNGTITVIGSGGARPYNCSCTGKTDLPADPSCIFRDLTAGAKTITLKDSSSIQLSCIKTVTLTESDPSSPGNPTCDPRLDTQYLAICRETNGNILITFKAYPVQPAFYQFRIYKIRWKLTGLNAHTPASPPSNISLTNAVITASGVENVAGQTYTYHFIRVPNLQVGTMTLIHIRPLWPFGHIRLEIATEIFYKKYRWPGVINSLLSIARFKLLVTDSGMDIRNIP